MGPRLTWQDFLVVILLFVLPLLLLGSVTIGPHTLLPADNLYTAEPWASYASQLGVDQPHNALLSDLVLENYVWKKLITQGIRDRSLPLWDPYLFAGHPFLANGQHSALYPFSIIFYVLPLVKAYGWFTVFQLWLAGLFSYLFLRVLGVNRLGSLVTAITFQLSTFFVVSIVFTMIIAAAAWLPLLLTMIEIIIRKQEQKGAVYYSPVPYVVVGALTLGIQVLAGHIEISYYVLLISGFYALCRLILLRRRLGVWAPTIRIGAWLLLMVLLGLALGFVQFVPLYEVASRNFRVGSVAYSDVVGWALPPRRIISFLVPDFFGNPSHHTYFDLVTRRWLPIGLNAHGEINPLCPNCTGWDTKTTVEAGAYLGILPLLLAAVAVIGWLTDFRKKRSGRQSDPMLPSQTPSGIASGQKETVGRASDHPQIWIFGLLSVLSLLFAFGTPLYALLYFGLPFWNQLHSPFRWIYPFTLSVAVLAGFGVNYLTRYVSWPPRSSAKKDQSASETQYHQIADPNGENTAPRHPIYAISQHIGWLAFWGGLAGVAVLLLALLTPAPFIEIAQMALDRSGLAQNAFADGRQFLGYQWFNFLKFFLFLMAGGAILRIARCPIFLPARLGGEPIWKPLVIFVLALDLLVAGYGFNPAADPMLLEFQPPVIDWLLARQEEDPHFRITSFDVPGEPHPLIANTGMYWNLQDVRGYDSIIPGQYAHYMNLIQEQGDLLYNRIAPIYAPGYHALDSALLDLLGVRYVLSTTDIPNDSYQLVYDNELRVYENEDALPRAFVVPYAQAVPADQMDYELRSLNPSCKVILEEEHRQDLIGKASPNMTEDCLLTPATITNYTANEVAIHVRMDQPGWLVLADSYFPGWKAYSQPAAGESNTNQLDSGQVQETELPIYKANGNFRAVYLEAGDWNVRFKYTPMSFKLGIYGTFMAAIITLLLLGWWAWGKMYRETDDDTAVKRIAKNSLAPMVMALLNRMIDFAFALLMLRILTPEGAGRFQFAVVFIGYMEILTRFGLGTLLTREVARDKSQANSYFSNVNILRVLLWLASLPLMGIFLWLYVLFGDVATETVIAIGLFAIGLFLSNISDALTALFYSFEKAEYPAAIATVTTVIRVSLGAMILLVGGGVIGLAGVSVVANVTAVLILGSILWRKVLRPHYDNDPSLRRHMLHESFPLMINHLLATVFFRIDVLILQPTWGDRSVGLYGAAYKYIDGINIIPSYFTLAIFPLMSRYAKTARDSLVRSYTLSLRLLLMIALPISVGTPFIARDLILILGGQQYMPESVIALQLLIWFLPFSFVNQVTQYVLIAIDQQRFLTKAFIIGVGFNVAINLFLIPRYGFKAAAVTTVFSEWALLIPFYYCVRKHLCCVPWWDVVWRPLVASAAMGAALWGLRNSSALLIILIGPIIYFTVLALAGGFRQPDMDMVWRILPLDRLRARLPGGAGQ